MPGQFQVRYYTVRSLDGDQVVVDVVIHAVGLVTEWASGECVGDTVVVTAPQGSFARCDMRPTRVLDATREARLAVSAIRAFEQTCGFCATTKASGSSRSRRGHSPWEVVRRTMKRIVTRCHSTR